ncbi:Uncharacterised protein [Campylobacter hyointestinalis subsp. hyointestinalis]|uniref:Lipoprotein n=1 Tax=Campylobacter hyointestinalis subsp. hyointestinalis TaxID=91352 RepID=A0A0S4SWE6_CAMHY|nr:hypothetical protein [Campylobacter hyointestinalis]CUU90720.1 Uncharacterised protein [Campylobacter hyointestinalis subsp. hyointestinalis]
MRLNLKSVVLPALLAIFMSGCAMMNQQNLNNIQNSEYPEFTQKFASKLPPFKSSLSFDMNSSILKVDFESNNIRGYLKLPNSVYYSDFGPATLEKKYLASTISQDSIYLKVFKDVSSELGLDIKKYKSGINKYFLNQMPVVNAEIANLSSKTKINYLMDNTYIAYDKEGNMRAILAYYHTFFYAAGGTGSQNVYNVIYFGSAARYAEQILGNDVLNKYEY